MQHAKQSAWPYIKKTAYVVQMNEFYVGGKPREAVCIIIYLIIQVKIAENPGTLFKKRIYQIIFLSIVVLDICLLETFPL